MLSNLKKVAVLGWPVHHSLSPRQQDSSPNHYKINGKYEAIATEPQHLQSTLYRLADIGYAGVNLTLPLKEKALALMDEVDEYAQKIGAINTVVMREGRTFGSNTDVYGFMQNLEQGGWHGQGRALVLGAGGAARAICAGLLSKKVPVTLVNRTRKNADTLARAFGGKIQVTDWDEYSIVMQDCSLLVNTTCIGMEGQPDVELSLAQLPKETVVTDIVYRPLLTPLLKEAAARGNKVIDGLGMLLYQAQPGFEAWFGVKPEVTMALRTYVLEGIE